ncbi:hypothetical protein CDIK_1964 [Cucumispora dikerogammari]|nr:hypothetical protein CDIK_1964 [Cucumispora dikerogammari]
MSFNIKPTTIIKNNTNPSGNTITSNNNTSNNDYNEDTPHRPHPPTQAVISNNNNDNNNDYISNNNEYNNNNTSQAVTSNNNINNNNNKCKYCNNTYIRTYYKYNYCYKCNIYITITNNKYISPKYIPTNILTLCKTTCKLNKQTIYCNSFKSYIKKLKICKICKKVFKPYLKDLYYRHCDLFLIKHNNLFSYNNYNYNMFIIYLLLILILYLYNNNIYISVVCFLFANIFNNNVFNNNIFNNNIYLLILELIILLFFNKYFYLTTVIMFFKLRKQKKYAIPFLLNNDSICLIKAFDKLSVKEEKKGFY